MCSAVKLALQTPTDLSSPTQEGSSHHVDGWYTMKNVLEKAGIDCSIINASNQRGRISTMYASIEVAEGKIERTSSNTWNTRNM